MIPARTGCNSILALICLATAPLLSGCLVGPDFHRPSPKMPGAFVSASETTPTLEAAGTRVELARWWESFNDPVLNSLIQRGIESNLDVQVAVHRVRQARAVLGESFAGLWPTLDFSSSYNRTHTRVPKPPVGTHEQSSGVGGVSTGTNRSSNQNSYRAGFDSAWELDAFGGTRRAIEASRADLLSSEENLRNTLVTLTGDIGVNYLNLRALQESLRITHENLVIQKHSADITIKRREAGFASALDQSNAEAIVASTTAQIPNIESQIRQTIYQLSVLLGQEPAALVAELNPSKPYPAPSRRLPTELPATLLDRRPDIRIAEASLHSATARIGVAVADLFPRLTLSANATAQANKIGSWNREATTAYGFGPSLSWNIFNGGLLWNRVRENRASADLALTQYRQAVLNALQEVETAWTAYNNEIERSRWLEVAVERERNSFRLSSQLYTAGETDFLSVLVSEQALLNSQNSLIQSRNAIAGDLVTLYKALGGGWSDEVAAGAETRTPATYWKK
ncbi:efflux transporter outer membrane subunit [bacterium]|nr:efflux transporter outer membrane subunit [bacterium]